MKSRLAGYGKEKPRIKSEKLSKNHVILDLQLKNTVRIYDFPPHLKNIIFLALFIEKAKKP